MQEKLLPDIGLTQKSSELCKRERMELLLYFQANSRSINNETCYIYTCIFLVSTPNHSHQGLEPEFAGKQFQGERPWKGILFQTFWVSLTIQDKLVITQLSGSSVQQILICNWGKSVTLAKLHCFYRHTRTHWATAKLYSSMHAWLVAQLNSLMYSILAMICIQFTC